MADKNVDATERKQQTVKQGFERSAIKLDQKIEEIARTHDATINAMQRERIKELRELIQKRTQIEQEIVTATNELQDSYNQTKEVLEVVLEGRIGDCEQSLKQLQGIANEEGWDDVEESQEL